MEDLLDLIYTDQSAAKVSDSIKDILYQKSSQKIDELRPLAAASLFGNGEAAIPEPEAEGEE